jgi:hypothetical protein
MSKLDLMLEADRRGLLPPEQKAMLAEATRRGLIPSSKPSQTQVAETPERSVLQNVGRQLGLTARGATKAITALPSIVGDLLGMDTSGAVSRSLSRIGLPEPESSAERVAQDIVGVMSGTAGIGSIAGLMSRLPRPSAVPGYVPPGSRGATPQTISSMFAANPGLQQISAVGAGGAGGIARETGAGPGGQFSASILGGIAAPVSISAAQSGGRALMDTLSTFGASSGNRASIERLARKAAQNIAGDTLEQQYKALLGATEYGGVRPNAAEAIAEANIGKPTQFGGATIRLQKDLSGARGLEDVLPSAQRAQQVAIEAPVIRMAGGNTPQQRAAAVAQAAAIRDQITGPMRETALANANIAGIKVPQLERRIASRGAEAAGAVEDVRRLSQAGQVGQNLAHGGTMRLDTGAPPTPGLPRVPERYGYGTQLAGVAERRAGEAAGFSLQRGAERRFLESQLGSLEAHGLRPLEGSKIVGHIDRMLDRPGEGIVTLNQKVLGAVRDKIAEAVAKRGGRLDAEDLYAIRKTEINDVVAALTKDANASTKNRAATLANSIKSRIDDAIEAAGGSGWKDYLNKYSELSNQIDQMKVAGAILEKMRSDVGKATPGSLLKVLGTGEEALLKRSLGGPRATEIEQVFPAAKAKQLRDIEAHMLRAEEANRIAAGVKGSGASTLGEAGIQHPPTLLLREMMLTNWVLKLLRKDPNTPVAKYVAEKMRDAGTYADLLRKPPLPFKVPISDAARYSTIGALIQQQEP